MAELGLKSTYGGGADGGGRGTTEAAEDDELTGDDAFVRQFLTIQLQENRLVMS